MKPRITILLVGALGLVAAAARPTFATTHGHMGGEGPGMMGQMMGPGLMMPTMDPARGRQLFASKGCVVCHSVNNIGGHHTPFDASTMPRPMNAFEFAAKMWRGAEAMTFLQREDLGYVIDLTGDELADIIAFVHDEEEQKKFSRTDIPPEVLKLLDGQALEREHDDREAEAIPYGH